MPAFPVFPSRPDITSWWARVRPSRVALIDRTRDARLTYAELDAESERWARLLHGMGIGPGERVAVLGGNATRLIALFGGCLRTGAMLLPLNWRLAASELSSVLADSTHRLVDVVSSLMEHTGE